MVALQKFRADRYSCSHGQEYSDMLGDGNSEFGSGPVGGPVDPTQPLVNLVTELDRVTSITFDDPEAFVDEMVDELLDMPRAERFERGAAVVEQHITKEFGGIEGFEAQFPLAAAMAASIFDELLNAWANEIAGRALEANGRQKNSLLVILQAIDSMQTSLRMVRGATSSNELDKQRDPDGQSERTAVNSQVFASIIVSLYARFYREIQRDINGQSPDIETLAEDVVYSEQVTLAAVHGSGAATSIDEMDRREILLRVIQMGAARAYEERDMSVARGAELAETSQEAFVELLEMTDREPDYGPDSVEDLYSGPDLLKE